MQSTEAEPYPGPSLLVVVDGRETAGAVHQMLADQLREGAVELVTGYYAAVAAVSRRCRVVIMDPAVASPREDWQLAELRARSEAAVLVVVAAEPRRSQLSSALRPDLAVESAAALPPLRELITGPARLSTQPSGRRTST